MAVLRSRFDTWDDTVFSLITNASAIWAYVAPLTADAVGAAGADALVHANAQEGVTWLHSYVTTDKTASFCVYDGPDADAIHQAARATGLTVDAVTEVRVLDPYFYY